MRFIFENGGKTGMWDAEALAFALEVYIKEAQYSAGRLLVDYSPTKSGPGQEFRPIHVFLADIQAERHAADTAEKETGIRQDMDAVWTNLAGRYWAEAEAVELARVSAKSTPAKPKRL